MTNRPDVEKLLPLRPAVFGILMVLRTEPLHGYGVMKRANEHVGHQAILGAGTLYRTLKELREGELIEHTTAPRQDDDARRQYYRLTARGEALVAAEQQRLHRLLTSVADPDLAVQERR